jgi:hypothetical protein
MRYSDAIANYGGGRTVKVLVAVAIRVSPILKDSVTV